MILTLFLYLLLGVVLIVMARQYTRGEVGNFLREPISLTLGALVGIHSIIPLLRYPFGLFRYGGGYTVGAHIYSIILVMIFALLMAGAYSLVRGKIQQIDRYPMVLVPMSPTSTLYLFLFMIIPSMAASIIYYRTIQSFGYEEYMSDRITFGSEHRGLSLLLAHWLYISVLVCCAGFVGTQNRSKGLLVTTIVLGIFTLLYFGYTGNRNSVFLAYVAASGVYLLTRRKSESLMRFLVSKQVLVIIAVFAFMAVIGEIRKLMIGMKRGDGSILTTVIDTIEGGFGNHDNVLWLVDNDFELQYGGTYLAGFLNVVPRAMWPEKPVGAGPIFKNFVDPGSYQVGKHGISSLTTGLVTEAYMNGGLIGVVLVAISTGVILGMLARLRGSCREPWSLSIYCYAVIILAFSMAYSEFLGGYTRWLIGTSPLVMGWWLSRNQVYELGGYHDEGSEGFHTQAQWY